MAKPRTSSQLNPAPCFRRQDNIFDTGLGYLGNNPLALWRITFVTYDGKPVGDFSSLQSLIAENDVGDIVTVRVRRAREVIERQVTLGEWE